MENPAQKKRIPWIWVAAGCGVAAIGMLFLTAVIVIAFVALPMIRARTASQIPSLKLLPTPRANLPALPNTAPKTGPGNGNSNGALPFQVSAVQDPGALPQQSLMDQVITSLNLNNDTDFMAPQTYKGTATLDPSTSFTLGNGWCAKDTTTLKQNLENMQYQLSINGNPIDLSQYPTLYVTDDQDHACAMTGIAITPNGNLSESYHVILTQKFLKSLDDGITSSPYPAGDVTFDFNVQFQSGPNSGNKT
jgi:hypothetical protein